MFIQTFVEVFQRGLDPFQVRSWSLKHLEDLKVDLQDVTDLFLQCPPVLLEQADVLLGVGLVHPVPSRPGLKADSAPEGHMDGGVAPETLVRTRYGEIEIGALVRRPVQVYDACHGWVSAPQVVRTYTDQELVRVTVRDPKGSIIGSVECIDVHGFPVQWVTDETDYIDLRPVAAAELQPGQWIRTLYEHPDDPPMIYCQGNGYIESVEPAGRRSDVFSIGIHEFVLNGIFVSGYGVMHSR